ncbi:MAG: tRNA uridine-5-carboxymethylaminomethyl(34) synthesis enzyme MnmG [Defluviitaleaceae bacterium]|nr:tRNA uridine-5-carboxymethylaminomethyl(34) synthesis enzyme MnmG [Defluviitaleaceae bacterium]
MEKKLRAAVIGGGHAGCEAALALARTGIDTTLFAIDLDSIAAMPCNPCIGGSAKGHLVREVDALGGQMGKNIDRTFIQSRMLNTAKGPAVYSLRAQADKKRYSELMKHTLETTMCLTIKQNEIKKIQTSSQPPHNVTGVITESGYFFAFNAVIVCSGTYMEARCLCGETIVYSGPGGRRASKGLSGCILDLGFDLMRFKTGTPARIHRGSVDFSKMEIQPGDENVVPFSFETDPKAIYRPQIPCYLTYTNEKTHEIIRNNIHRSPMYSGLIEGVGTRYCPSIEDKIVRFADKERHPVFIEPEGESTEELYVQGLSTSLPEDIQEELYRTVPGLENCEIMRGAYAIEYDCINAAQLKLSLEAKKIPGLFFAGQVNGSSGYEEAAGQGILAGINASLYLRGREALVIKRSEGYIGVLADDLVTKGTREPYRMMTSRAEYRLLLRQDNADLRLTEYGYAAGLIGSERYEMFCKKREHIERETERVCKTVVAPSEKNENILIKYGSAGISSGHKLSELIKRPELSYGMLAEADPSRPESFTGTDFIDEAIAEQVNTQIKYEGYIKMQVAQAEQFLKMEQKKLPPDMDYLSVKSLRIEARQKLNAQRPENIGQASRITGVSPADINVLLVMMKK